MTVEGSEAPTPYALGIDLGTNSVGWAAVRLNHEKSPVGLIGAGVRIFAQGTEGDIASGRDASRNVKRRQARQARRQADRRDRRKTQVFHILQRAGLLPNGDSVHEIITALDADLLEHHVQQSGLSRHELSSSLPYYLRARALDAPLTKYELGRVLYHLAQRRGFLSNRRAPVKEDEELGQVKEAISELGQTIEQNGKRTLGELFAGMNPHTEKVRRRWTGRAMFESEFEAIWKAQSHYHLSVSTDALREELSRAMFYQRPLKSQRHLVGECELEPGCARAPKALLMFQRWRILQNVNNLRLRSLDTGEDRDLTPEERSALVDALDTQGTLTFAKARKLLKVGRGWKFNLEEADRKNLEGNTTAARLRPIFGDRWDKLTPAERDQVVEDIRSISSTEALVRRTQRRWRLDQDAAQHLAECRLEDGYASISRRAIEKTLSLLEEGKHWAQAKEAAYPFAGGAVERLKKLPPVLDAPLQSLHTLRNPVVMRSLTELRKVVNAIILEYGLPEEIHIELGRDLKRPRGEREKIWKRQRDNEKKRSEIAKRIVTETGNADPSRDDIEKVRLAEEQNWVCPYTGKTISMAALVGAESQFDVDHIIPRAISFDDSLANKVVCDNASNREKGNRTPLEAFGGDPDGWAEISERVKKFDQRKWARFQWTADQVADHYGDFSERQLNDTRYASRLAADYLGLLYGGRVDASGKSRIQVGQGRVTAELRRSWDLEGILSDGQGKTRDDHRHHAVDAVVIALTTPSIVKRLSVESSRHADRLAPGVRTPRVHLSEPWPGFSQQVRVSIAKIIPSHQRSTKVRGALHEETLYSRERSAVDKNGKVLSVRHVRKAVRKLTKSEIENIVDARVRDVVRAKVDEVGGDPKRLSDDDPPVMFTRDDRKQPIKRVRIEKPGNAVVSVGSGPRERHVMPGNNHHVEIFEVADTKGNVAWHGRVVTLLEAMDRKCRKKPIVDREWNAAGEGRFVFSLCGGDTIRTLNGYYVIKTFWRQGNSVTFRLTSVLDARKEEDIPRAGRQPSLSALKNQGCEKVVVDPLGRVIPAHD
ncbi:MAG: type II CRISPR RNA-guided endonuclease Cas9 [Acidimicrobiales bacterium]